MAAEVNPSRRVKRFLDKRSQSPELIPSRDLGRLVAIDDAITRLEKQREEGRALIRESAVSISRVASEIGLSRGTIYNNEILRSFIEDNAAEADPMTHQVDRLKEENERLKEEVCNFMLRDVDVLRAEEEVEKLHREVERLNQLNGNLNYELAKAKGIKPPAKPKRKKKKPSNNLEIVDGGAD